MKTLIIIIFLLTVQQSAAWPTWFEGTPPGRQDDDNPGNSEHDHKDGDDPPTSIDANLIYLAIAGISFAFIYYSNKSKTNRKYGN